MQKPAFLPLVALTAILAAVSPTAMVRSQPVQPGIEAGAKTNVEARAKTNVEARAKANAEARAKINAEARAKTNAEARAKANAEARAKAKVEGRAASVDANANQDGFAGVLAIVNKNPNDSAQLDHVRLLNTDQQLNERVDFESMQKYIITACATTSAFFNSVKHSKPIGLSVHCDLLPTGQAVYQLEVRPKERQDTKLALALSEALEKVKVPKVTGPISLQILMKVWYPKPQAATFFKSGFELQKSAKYKQAIQQYSQALAIDPGLTEAYTCRAIAYNASGEYDKAVADLTKAISLGSHDAYIARAYSYRHLNDAENAMADCNRAIELDPRYWEGYVSRAELWQDTGNYEDAIKDCDTVLQFMSTCGYAYLVRGEAHLSRKEPDDAVRDLSMAVEILPKSSDAYHYRAEAYHLIGKDEEATADEGRAKELGFKAK